MTSDVVGAVDTVVVGAGQGGLAVSHLLQAADIAHVVLERGRVGESWRSQRWDTFHLNTPNWANLLPDAVLGDRDPDAFAARDDLVMALEAYAASLPIQDHTEVLALDRRDDGDFAVTTTTGRWHCRNVVVASGGQNRPRLPPMAAATPAHITTLTAADYRSPDALEDGAVVVVGSGQSGCQIVEDLLAAGRTVHLCTSKVARLRRRYRGRDSLSWLVEIGFFDTAVEDLEAPAMQFEAQPQISGTNGGHTISLQSLARDGAILLGRAVGIDGTTLALQPTVRECAAFADERSARATAMIDEHIARHGIDAPPAEPDPDEVAMPDLGGSDRLTSLDLDEAGVTTIIWCVGFDGDLSWLGGHGLDDRGRAAHRRGVSSTPGLYFIGFPWLSRRKSGILLGVDEDATRVVAHLTASARRPRRA